MPFFQIFTAGKYYSYYRGVKCQATPHLCRVFTKTVHHKVKTDRRRKEGH